MTLIHGTAAQVSAWISLHRACQAAEGASGVDDRPKEEDTPMRSKSRTMTGNDEENPGSVRRSLVRKEIGDRTAGGLGTMVLVVTTLAQPRRAATAWLMERARHEMVRLGWRRWVVLLEAAMGHFVRATCASQGAGFGCRVPACGARFYDLSRDALFRRDGARRIAARHDSSRELGHANLDGTTGHDLHFVAARAKHFAGVCLVSSFRSERRSGEHGRVGASHLLPTARTIAPCPAEVHHLAAAAAGRGNENENEPGQPNGARGLHSNTHMTCSPDAWRPSAAGTTIRMQRETFSAPRRAKSQVARQNTRFDCLSGVSKTPCSFTGPGSGLSGDRSLGTTT